MCGLEFEDGYACNVVRIGRQPSPLVRLSVQSLDGEELRCVLSSKKTVGFVDRNVMLM